MLAIINYGLGNVLRKDSCIPSHRHLSEPRDEMILAA
jgi:hypothetical protein